MPMTDSVDRQCFNPLHCAAKVGNADVVKTLLDGGADLNSRAYAGYTPLHIAVSSVWKSVSTCSNFPCEFLLL